jgi:hypothetical protein
MNAASVARGLDAARGGIVARVERERRVSVVVFGGHGCASTPGARRAIDAFFTHKPEIPIVLRAGQAIVVKTPEA